MEKAKVKADAAFELMNKLSVEQIELLESVAGWEWQKTSGSGSRKKER
jgi:hypothetical protein